MRVRLNPLPSSTEPEPATEVAWQTMDTKVSRVQQRALTNNTLPVESSERRQSPWFALRRQAAACQSQVPFKGAFLLSAVALLLAALPYIAGFAAAPRGTVFLGALNNVGDTGQYLAAIRQGMDAAGVSRLLYIDQYSSLRVVPVLMYPFYTVAGVVFSPFHPSVMAVYQLLHVLAAVALLGALWRFCRAVSPGGSPVLAYALALFGGGLYAPALLLSGVVRLPIAPVALTAPELSLFATLLISPHGAAGLAAQLWALAGYLRWRRHGRVRDLAALALGGLALGLCYPFGIVVLVAVVAVDIVMSPRPLRLGFTPRPPRLGFTPRPPRLGFTPRPPRLGFTLRPPTCIKLILPRRAQGGVDRC